MILPLKGVSAYFIVIGIVQPTSLGELSIIVDYYC